jgi:hypothetical protein
MCGARSEYAKHVHQKICDNGYFRCFFEFARFTEGVSVCACVGV